VYFAWPLVAASLYSGLPLGPQPTASQLTLGTVAVPLEAQFFRVNYRGPEGTIPTYSVLQVVNGDYAEFEPEAFRDKVVFIGATTESLQDTHPTAFDAQRHPA
jgi:CHASE2 domain-containing sensor protein